MLKENNFVCFDDWYEYCWEKHYYEDKIKFLKNQLASEKELSESYRRWMNFVSKILLISTLIFCLLYCQYGFLP